MKVFHIISHFDLGGAERVAASIAMSHTPGMEYHIVEAMRGRGAFTDKFLSELREAGVVCHRAWMPDLRFHFLFERIEALLFPLRFLPIFLRHRPDVIHAHTELPDMCTVAFFKLFSRLRKTCRVVRTIHNTRLWTGQALIGRMVERFYRRNATQVAISPGVARLYADAYGGEEPMVIFNGVGEVEQKRYEGLREGKINILFSGRFEPQKGIETLIEIIETTKALHLPYHFHLFGDGSMRAEIEHRVGSLDIVSLNPPLFGLASRLASFDYMLMPSEFEGLSIVAIEASMAGLPNIISDIPGLRETVPGDWPLKGDFIDILKNKIPSLSRQALSHAARLHARAHFSLATMRRGYEEVYRR